MTILNPISTSNQLLQTTSTQPTTQAERQVDLRLEQIVRATVVEAGLDRVLLEMNHRQYRTQSDQQLQIGQKLTLQVLQVHPQLEFRVINDPAGERLTQLLPLLSRPYNWVQLIDSLQQLPGQRALPSSMPQVFSQLQQLLQPGGSLPQELDAELGKVTAQLKQFLQPAVTDVKNVPPQVAAVVHEKGQPAALPAREQLPVIALLIKGLSNQLTKLSQKPSQSLPQEWVVQTRNLLAPLSQPSKLPQSIPPQQFGELTQQLNQLRQQPQLPQKLLGEIDRVLMQLVAQQNRVVLPQGRPQVPQQVNQQSPAQVAVSSPAAPPTAPEQGATLQNPGSPTAALPAAKQVSASTPAPAAVKTSPELAAELEKIVTQVQQAQNSKGGLPADLLGKIEGLLHKFQQVPQQAQAVTVLMPNLALISSQLSELVQSNPLLPKGEQLGLLSQLFGFHLEAELANGKQKAALASLKLNLLALQKESAEELKEPLQRLELFQLCKVKFATENVQFFPLPFNELEEGYLLAENRQEAEDEDSQATASTQLSMSLRLSALGNLQIDMLVDKQGLHLRIAGEDQEKMTYLQQCAGELEESITSLPLQGLSFGSDAQLPSRRLLERLLPEALGMLDTRI